MQKYPLENYDERSKSIDGIVLHCCAFSAEEAIKSFEEAGVSAHYIIDLNGKIIKLVDVEKRAWHAGKSFWKNQESLNNNTIGVEVCNLSLGQTPYDKRQIFALMRLCKSLMKKYHISKKNIVGHADIAPSRKADPGKCFPWAYLARHGIGLWYEDTTKTDIQAQNQAELLSRIGYDVSNLTAAKWAFCRHYLGKSVPDDNDIKHLIDNPYPPDFTVADEVFLPVLKAVAEKHFK